MGFPITNPSGSFVNTQTGSRRTQDKRNFVFNPMATPQISGLQAFGTARCSQSNYQLAKQRTSTTDLFFILASIQLNPPFAAPHLSKLASPIWRRGGVPLEECCLFHRLHRQVSTTLITQAMEIII
uniref:Uncharacterized protein n=1 Tax=Sphaerodactylus townsendi TaxID=933632 RepID=A0ACB8F102_9SAUR